MPKHSSMIAGGGSSAILPTAYTVNQCILTSNSGKEYDIKGLVAEIDIVEELESESILVTLGIRDAIQFLENALITGNEKIFLSIQHTTLEKNNKTKKKFDLDLKITEVTGLVRPKPGLQIYRVLCFKEHMYNDAIKKLVRPFEGSLGSLIADICKKDMKVKKIGKLNTETKGILKGIFPRISPIDAIQWLKRNSFDGQTPFYFFDTAAEGIKFDSYKSMCEEEVHKIYFQRPFLTTKIGTDEHYQEVSEQITRLSSDMNSSPLVNVNNGAYGSTMHTLDYSNKEYNTFFYDYNNQNPCKLNKNKPFSENADIDGIKYSQTRDSKHYFISLNKKSYELDNYHSTATPTLLISEAVKENLTQMAQTITVAGDYTMTPGKKITINIPKSLGIDATGLKDMYLTGDYIVHRIHHTFRDEYNMQIDCIKDSTNIDLDGEPM